MRDSLEHVEVDENQNPIRIFRTFKDATASPAWDEQRVAAMSRKIAVGKIREQIFKRQGGRCLNCPSEFTLDGDLFHRMHLHEQQTRGNFGEISLDNSVGLCHHCHIKVAHGARRPRFGEKTL